MPARTQFMDARAYIQSAMWSQIARVRPCPCAVSALLCVRAVPVCCALCMCALLCVRAVPVCCALCMCAVLCMRAVPVCCVCVLCYVVPDLSVCPTNPHRSVSVTPHHLSVCATPHHLSALPHHLSVPPTICLSLSRAPVCLSLRDARRRSTRPGWTPGLWTGPSTAMPGTANLHRSDSSLNSTYFTFVFLSSQVRCHHTRAELMHAN